MWQTWEWEQGWTQNHQKTRTRYIPANKIKPQISLKGMKKCTQQCTAWPFIEEGTEIKGDKFKWNITKMWIVKLKTVCTWLNVRKNMAKKDTLGKQKEN